MKHFLLTLFAWPNGIVVGNLIATAICLAPGFFHLDRLSRKQHREHLSAIRENANGKCTDDN